MDKSKFGSDERINKLQLFLGKYNGIDPLQLQSKNDSKLSNLSNPMVNLLGIYKIKTGLSNPKRNHDKFSRRSLDIFQMEIMKMKMIKSKEDDEKSNENDFDIPNEYVTTYIPPRKGVDDALDEHFKSQTIMIRNRNNNEMNKINKINRMNAIGICSNSDDEILVCQICAGYHETHDCKERCYTCHMCGDKGHRMFECQRAKCFSCLNLGHISEKCPNRNVM